MTSALLLSANAYTADYGYIDPGDYYYINRWGDDNERVVVVRKLGNNRVKVRDLNTGATQVIEASKLLTKSELDSEELANTVGGTAIGLGVLFCLINPEAC